MNNSGDIPEAERLSIPHDLDLRTLQYVADLWNSILTGARATQYLMSVEAGAKPDFKELKGEAFDAAARELINRPITPEGEVLGELAALRTVVVTYGSEIAAIRDATAAQES